MERIQSKRKIPRQAYNFSKQDHMYLQFDKQSSTMITDTNTANAVAPVDESIAIETHGTWRRETSDKYSNRDVRSDRPGAQPQRDTTVSDLSSSEDKHYPSPQDRWEYLQDDMIASTEEMMETDYDETESLDGLASTAEPRLTGLSRLRVRPKVGKLLNTMLAQGAWNDIWRDIYNEKHFPDIGPPKYDTTENWWKVGGYSLKKRLGAGGFGKVFAAESIAHGTEVAIKQVRKIKAKKSHVKVVDQEIHILRKHGGHPNIIGFYEAIHTSKNVYIVMEKATMTLPQVTERQVMQLDFRQQVMKGILNGVAYLHSQGVQHLDLKSENILLVQPQPGHRVEDSHIRIADFGVSQVSTTKCSTMVPAGHRVGTFGTMAPELVLGYGGDAAAADIWSIGCIGMEMGWGVPKRWRDSNASHSAFAAEEQHWNYKLQGFKTCPLLYHFLSCIFSIDPAGRSSAADLARHPYLETKAHISSCPYYRRTGGCITRRLSQLES